VKRGVVHNLTAAERRDIARLYTEGLSLPAIGRRKFCSGSTIRRVLVLEGVTLRRSGGVRGAPRVDNLTQEQLDECVELYRSGLSATEVAEKIGVHAGTVYYRLRQAGVPVRARPEAQRLRYRSRVAHAGENALNERQFTVLRFVEAEQTGSREVARLLGVSTQTARDTLDQLENYGLVSRRPSKRNKRHLIWSRSALPVIDTLHHAITPPPQPEKGDVWLPIAPLREWIESLVAHEEQKARFTAVASTPDGDGTGALPTIQTVAKRLGIIDKRLYMLRFEQKSVTLGMADRLLLSAGDGTRLGDLWPELADGGDITAIPKRAIKPPPPRWKVAA
jgi:transposase